MFLDGMLLVLSVAVPLVLAGLERAGHKRLPRGLSHLALSVAVVMALLSVLGLFSQYIPGFQLPRLGLRGIYVLAALLTLAAFIRTFFPFAGSGNGVD